jgi:hypothetical protein
MGGKSQTSTSSQTTTPVAGQSLQDIYNKIQQAANTPYTPYNGELTAPINAQQQQGIAGINGAAGQAQGSVNQALGTISGASNPLTAQQIQNYQNPYTQSVIDATQKQFNAQNAEQQNQLKGSAAAAGALGGDRQAVAQAELARQQDVAQAPVIAGLQQQGYNQAVQTAEQQYQTNPLAAAGQLANTGIAGQSAALQGAQAQMGAGSLEQQTQQQADQAQYQQYLQQMGYPFQTAAFFAQYGIPAAVAQGSNSYGTQTTQGPSIWSQLGGLGLAGAGLFLKDGGEVDARFADGGMSSMRPVGLLDIAGYVPKASGVPSGDLHAPSLQFAKSQNSGSNGMGSITSGLGALKGKFGGPSYGGGNVFTDPWGGSSSSPLEGLDASDYGPGFGRGGFIDAVNQIHRAIRRARGGEVSINMPFAGYSRVGIPHYADGGDTFDDRFNASFPQMAAPAPADNSPAPDDQGPTDPSLAPIREVSPEAMDEWRAGVDHPNAAQMSDTGPKPVTPAQIAQGANMPARDTGNPMTAAALPPQITDPDSVGDDTSMAYTAPRIPIAPAASPATTAPAASDDDEGHFGFGPSHVGLSDRTRQALFAAGMGMLSSRSPFFGVALGEGGLKGLSTYSDIGKQMQQAREKEETRSEEQQRIDLEAKRLAESTAEFAKTNARAERRLKLQEDETPNNFKKNPDYGKIDGAPEYIPKTGTPADPDYVARMAEAKNRGLVSDDDAKDTAYRYVRTGDRGQLQGLGYKGENRAKVNHYIHEAQTALGVSDEELGQRVAEFEGRKAGQRTLGTQEARMGSAAMEAEGAIKLARGAIEKVPRTSFLPINRLIKGYQEQTLNPDQAELFTRLQGVVNAYSAVMNRGANVATDASRHRANELLNDAADAPALNRVLDVMNSEMDMAKSAPARMREYYRQQYGARSVDQGTAAGAPGAAPATVPGQRVRQNGHTFERQPNGSYRAID